MDLGTFIDKVNAFDTTEAIHAAARSEAFLNEVVHWQRDQLEQGLNSKGQKIGRYQSPEYAQIKYEMNARAGRGNVDLILTHDFEKNIKATSSGDSITIDSGDWKSDMLQQRYGEEIFGLSEELREDPSYVLQQEFIKEFRNEVGI